ncbi:hypothetical protein B9Z55_007061 [Caenorhabditis nigoni]|nr:hypothetical protein B9Z55_007061 [Caenorhabditis nigoni]
MVSYSIPVGYESLRAILLHTDPNLRFRIAQRIPKIRLTEKTVPLKINSLSLNASEFVINSQSYKLGVYFDYGKGEIPNAIRRQNNKGGVSCDVDQYGFKISNLSTPILNGDVSFRTKNEDDHRNDTEETERGYWFELKLHEDALAKINQLESEGKTIEDFLTGPMTEDDQRIEDVVEIGKEHIQMHIDIYRSELIPFHCRRHNLALPFTCFIQLTITRGNVKTIQRYFYNHKLYEASKKLNDTLFANRPVIIVNQLQSDSFNVLRLPIGMKISANSIYGDDSQIVYISSILDHSRTLLRLGFHLRSDLVLNFQHSFVKYAEKLLMCPEKELIDQLAEALGTIENQKIQITFFRFDNPSATDYFQLLQGWVSTERCIGSMISFGLRTDEIGKEILELVRTRNERTESTDRCVTILQRNATKIEISYSPLPKENQYKMVSYSIPMGYESLRTVLLHTDPNLRFKIAQRIPKIRLTEKAVPLRIEQLSLEEFKTTVNSQSYTLGVYRHFHTKEIPMKIETGNNWEGVSCDLDQGGRRIPNSFTPILNGDVSSRMENTTDRQRDTEETEQGYQDSLRRYEKALEKINQLESEGKTILMTEDGRGIRLHLQLKERLQLEIHEYRNDLRSFHYRRNSFSPPISCFIHLTITQGNVKTIQRYVYNHKLYEAAKKLNEILFANRPIIIVNKLHGGRGFNDVLRLPIGLKISANSVFGDNSQIVPISSILDHSRTLRRLDIHFRSELVLNLQHNFVKNAEKLLMYAHMRIIDQLAEVLETIENQQVQITFYQSDNPTANDYFQLMQGWLSTERNVGSVITFGLRTEFIGRNILNLVRTQNERTESRYR